MKELLGKHLPSFIIEKIRGRVYLQKVLENMGWLFFDKFFRMGIGLFVGVWVARYLGPEKYGTLGYAQAFVALFATFASLGLDSIVIRDIVNDPSCKDETLGTAFSLKLAGGFLTTVLSVAAIYLLRPEDTLTLYLVGIIAIGTVFQSFSTIDFWFSSQIQSKYTVYAQNIAFVIISVIKVVLILRQAPLIAFAWAALAEVIIGSAGLVAFYRLNGYSMRKWKNNWFRARQLLNQSWPLILSGVTIMIYMRIDQIMLGQMVGQYAVGIYTSAVKLSEVWYFIPSAIVASLTPALLDAKKVNETLYYLRLQKIFNLLAVIAYSVALPMTFLSHWIITILFGAEYGAAGPVLAIYIWAAVFVFQGVARGVWIVAEGLMKFSLATTFAGLVINVVLNYLLIPIYGPIGSALATVFSQFVASVGSNYFYDKTRTIGKMQMKSLLIFRLKR